MFDLDKSSVEYHLLYLQNLGLNINEYKKHDKTLSIEYYEQLLEYSIELLKAIDEYQTEANTAFRELTYHPDIEDNRAKPIYTKRAYKLFGIPIFTTYKTVSK